MPEFKASNALEPLQFDFRPHSDVTGEVPEPTDDQVAEFYAGLSTQLKTTLGEERLDGYDLDQPAEVGRLFSTLTADEHKQLYTAMLDLHSAVCGGTPTREQTAELPYRLRQAWYGMVQGWLRPESSRPATNS